jgi:hypothetical protein
MSNHSFMCEDHLWQYLRKQAYSADCSVSAYIRKLIINDRKNSKLQIDNHPLQKPAPKKIKKIIKHTIDEEYDDPPLDTNDRIINGERISYSSAVQDPDFTYEEWVEYPKFRVR